MGLDYTAGAVNFRDLGLWLNEIAGRELMPCGRVYRGGKLEWVETLSEIQNPQTILNLRRGPDPEFDARCEHICVPAGVDTNQTHDKVVRRWLSAVMQRLADPALLYPVYMHCTSGKDRTGVVAGAIGLVVGADLETVLEEYGLSEGTLHPEVFRQAMLHLQEVGLDSYFRRVDVDRLRARLLGED